MQARQLQNELLSAELPAKYRGLSLAKPGASYFTTADVLPDTQFHTTPYHDNRVRLQPTQDNKHGYINASHVTVSVKVANMFYANEKK